MQGLTNNLAELLIRSKKPLHFLHLAKTGGTTIRSAIGGRTLGKFRMRDKIFWKYYPKVIFHSDVPQSFEKLSNLVFFIRDPIARYQSGFEYAKRILISNEKTVHKESFADDPAKRKQLEFLFEQFSSFEEWIHCLSKTQDNVKYHFATSLKEAIPVLRMDYTYYFKDVQNVRTHSSKVIFIGSQETFTDDIKALYNLIGINSSKNQRLLLNAGAKKSAPKVNAQSRIALSKEYEIYDALLELKDNLKSNPI
jgi:hypothetical protein